MKKITTLFIAASLLFTMSCNNETTTETTETTATETAKVEANSGQIADKTYVVSNSESTIKWVGTKAIGGGHDGTINLAAGKFDVKDGKLAAGKLAIDMTTITALDLTDPDKKANLEGHLKDADFFNVGEFPAANLEIIDASNMDAVKANLTIKDKTNEITFPAKMELVDGVVFVTSELKIDRTKYGITYNSGNFFQNLGDKMINDEFTIAVKLAAK